MPNSKQQAVDLAKKMAKQVAQEPLEILKGAGDQIIGTPEKESKNPQSGENRSEHPNLAGREEKVKQKDTSLLRALETEIKDIQKQDVIQMLQSKIANGETVYLGEYPQLTPEQKQMLEAHIASVKFQREQQEAQTNTIPEPSSKQGRRMGQKQAAKSEATRVEKPVPPSG